MLKIATFNVENLFGRAKVLNLDDSSNGAPILEKIAQLLEELERPQYDQAKIFALYKNVKDWVKVSEERQGLFRRVNRRIVGIKATSREDWDGSLLLKSAPFSKMSRANTARVIREVDADILCVVEVENLPVLRSFNSARLRKQYAYPMLIDGNDRRGIDVGLLSKHEIVDINTHIFRTYRVRDPESNKMKIRNVFPRDCLEVRVRLAGGRELVMLCNHFKSKGYGDAAENDRKRKKQAETVAEILQKYDLTRELVVVAGDLNDTPGSAPLRDLLSVPDLHDVLETKFGGDMAARWSYHYQSNEQIDFLLVSKPLKDAQQDAGVWRIRNVRPAKAFARSGKTLFPGHQQEQRRVRSRRRVGPVQPIGVRGGPCLTFCRLTFWPFRAACGAAEAC